MATEYDELLNKLRGRDDAALHELEGLVQRVVNSALGRSRYGSAVDGEALAAEVLETLWKKTENGPLPVDTGGRLPAYVRGVVGKCMLAALRAERRARHRIEGTTPESLQDQTRDGLMVADEVFRAFDVARCGGIDWSLLSKDEFFVLRARTEGKSFRQIHEGSGTPLATLHKTYKRAVGKIRDQLREGEAAA